MISSFHVKKWWLREDLSNSQREKPVCIKILWTPEACILPTCKGCVLSVGVEVYLMGVALLDIVVGTTHSRLSRALDRFEYVGNWNLETEEENLSFHCVWAVNLLGKLIMLVSAWKLYLCPVFESNLWKFRFVFESLDSYFFLSWTSKLNKEPCWHLP